MTDHRKTVDDVLSRLERGDRDRISIAKEISIERVPTPSIGLTEALGGGWAMGREVILWGPKSAGKTTFCLEQIAILQKQGKVCAFLDAEGTYDPQWAERLGVDNNELIHVDSKSMNHMVDKTVKLMGAGIDVIIVDSITALVPAAYLEKDGNELKSMVDMGAMGAHARDMSKALQAIVYANTNTLVLLISQQRMKSMGMYWGAGPTGGMAAMHYASQIVKLYSSEGQSNSIDGKVHYGDRIVNKQVGRKVTYEVEFNKLGPQGGSGSYDLYFDGDSVGIDRISEVFDVALPVGIIEKAGGWFKFEGNIIGQGRTNAIQYFKDNEEDFRKVVELIGFG